MRNRFKYWWTFLYLPIYMFCFTWLEQRDIDVHIIGTSLDYKIPFVECFIVPYLLWFPFMALAFVGVFFASKEEYAKMAMFLMTGMTIFLIVSYIYPNGLDLRPEEMTRDNVFTRLILNLYGTDTSTNVIPSLHVFNSIGASIAILRTCKLNGNRWISIATVLLAVLIIMSTMFIKQHSVVDVLAAIIMAIVLYCPIYSSKHVLKSSHNVT